ncbi:MAG: LD-carboxypeptidase [Roseivirga sp.]
MLGSPSSVEHSVRGKHSVPIQPPLLRQGDKVAIVAPSFWLEDSARIVKKTVQLLESWGLEVVLGQHVQARHGRFAGTDAQRMEDMQWAMNDPTIRAILALRGGYGTTRIVDALDFMPLLQSPKWIIGFSDITTLHLRLHQLGITAVHGEMPKHFFKPQYASSVASLKTWLFEGQARLAARPNRLNRCGTVTAPVVGGNLTMICSNMETPSALDTDHKILVIEDVDVALFRLDRVMVQLKRTGKLEQLAGLVVGSMTNVQDKLDNPFGKSAEEIIQEHVAEYEYPVAFNFPVGHEAPNLAFPHGGVGRLCVEQEEVSLSFGDQ